MIKITHYNQNVRKKAEKKEHKRDGTNGKQTESRGLNLTVADGTFHILPQ